MHTQYSFIMDSFPLKHYSMCIVRFYVLYRDGSETENTASSAITAILFLMCLMPLQSNLHLIPPRRLFPAVFRSQDKL